MLNYVRGWNYPASNFSKEKKLYKFGLILMDYNRYILNYGGEISGIKKRLL